MNTLDAISGRRAINFFDADRQVPEETLRQLLETANTAPSSFNLQPWEVVLVTEPERKKALRECAFGQARVEEAPAVLIVIADPGAVESHVDRVLDDMIKLGYMEEKDREGSRRNPFQLYGESDSAARLVFAVKNTAFFAMNVMIAARGLGLESHPMDGFREKDVKREFDIPEDRIIPCLIAVGYPSPSLKLKPSKFRRPFDEFVHRERF